MLNIEVIRFEAQDVITASTPTPETPIVPDTPAEPAIACDCALYGCVTSGKYHYVPNADGGRTSCSGINYEHGCGN